MEVCCIPTAIIAVDDSYIVLRFVLNDSKFCIAGSFSCSNIKFLQDCVNVNQVIFNDFLYSQFNQNPGNCGFSISKFFSKSQIHKFTPESAISTLKLTNCSGPVAVSY